MIVKLRRPRHPQIAWELTNEGHTYERYVTEAQLPRHVLREAEDEADRDTYWYASLVGVGRISLHGRVPPQKW